MRTEKGDRMCKWQRGDAVARELAGKGKETAVVCCGQWFGERGRRRKPRQRRVKPAVVAEPRAHLMQACGFAYTRDSRAYLGACIHGTVMKRKLGKELRKCN